MSEPWLAFDAAWFAQWQRLLLRVLDEPLLGRWLRWVLCVTADDVGYRRRIIQLGPSWYVVEAGGGRYQMDCRSHDKYAKRIYFAFAPLWWAMHAWDWAIADRACPRLSFGFSTLTAYPDPHPETRSVDGIVERSGANEAWATLIAGAGTGARDTLDDDYLIRIQSTSTTNQFSRIARRVTLIYTPLPAVSVISAAVLSYRGTLKTDTFTTPAAPDVDVYGTAPASRTALVAADYGTFGATSYTGSPISYASFSTAGYNDFTLNAAGRSAIRKGGVSRFGVRNANHDVAASAPTWSSAKTSELDAYTANRTGTSSDPKLVVTYTVADGAYFEGEIGGQGGGFTDLSADTNVAAEPIEIEYGIQGGKPTDRIAGAGTMTWAMRNDASSSGGVNGYYMPGHVSCRANWELGTRVRMLLVSGGVPYYKFNGRLVDAVPDAGIKRGRAVHCVAQDWIGDMATTFIKEMSIQIDQRADEVITTLLTISRLLQPEAFALSTGQSTFSFSLDDVRDESTPVLRAIANLVYSEVGYAYVRGDSLQGGTFAFEDLLFRSAASVVADFDRTMFDVESIRSRDAILNSINVVVHPRKVDSAATTVLYALTTTETKPEIAAGTTLLLTVPFRDDTGQFVRVGATDIVTPEVTTDYLANTQADGGGADKTAQLSIVFSATSNSGLLAITNTDAGAVFVTKLQVRGKAVATRHDLLIPRSDATSITTYGERSISYDMPYVDTTTVAEAVADLLLARYKDPRTIVDSIRLVADPTQAAMYAQLLAREPGDKITLTETMAGLSLSPYFVNGVRLSITKGLAGPIINGSFALAPADIGQAWILEDAVYGLLEDTTILGFP